MSYQFSSIAYQLQVSNQLSFCDLNALETKVGRSRKVVKFRSGSQVNACSTFPTFEGDCGTCGCSEDSGISGALFSSKVDAV